MAVASPADTSIMSYGSYRRWHKDAQPRHNDGSRSLHDLAWY